jgi:heme-degrading monooxygenase HmoA
MVIMVIQHPVADFDAWKAAYDARNPGTFGATFARVHRMVGDPNTVAVVTGFESMDAANDMAQSPALKAAMDEAGVTGAPRFEFYEEVESVNY